MNNLFSISFFSLAASAALELHENIQRMERVKCQQSEKIQKLEEALNAAASDRKADICICKDRLQHQASEAAAVQSSLNATIDRLQQQLCETSSEGNATKLENLELAKKLVALQLERETMADENIKLHNQLHAANEAIAVELSEKKELQERCTQLTDEIEAGNQGMVANCDTSQQSLKVKNKRLTSIASPRPPTFIYLRYPWKVVEVVTQVVVKWENNLPSSLGLLSIGVVAGSLPSTTMCSMGSLFPQLTKEFVFGKQTWSINQMSSRYEIGTEGTPHLLICVQFNHPVTITALEKYIQELFGQQPDLQPVKGTDLDLNNALKYCSKPSTRACDAFICYLIFDPNSRRKKKAVTRSRK